MANPKLKHLFDEDKFKIKNYITQIGPPTKKTAELNDRQWRRIAKAKGKYENLDEKQKLKKKRPTKKASEAVKEVDKTAEVDKTTKTAEEIAIDENTRKIFSFDNPDRYKTDQLKE